MANAWEHPDIIAMEALTHLEDALIITAAAARDVTSEFSTRANGWKVGDTVSFRTHGDYEAKEFAGSIEIQNISSSKRSMTIEKLLDVSVELTARELAMDLDSFLDQVIKPAAYRLAEKCDIYVGTKILDAAGLYLNTSALLGASAADLAQMRKAAIIQQLAWQRFSIVNLDLEAVLLGQEWFNRADARGAAGVDTLQTGLMGHVMGMDWASSINFPDYSHASGSGTAVTDNTLESSNVIGATKLTFDGGSAAAGFNIGDRIAIAGVRRPLIANETVADASLATSVEVVDPITEIIPDNAAISVVGSGETWSPQGAIFDSQSLAVAFPVLEAPGDKESAVAMNNGISIRVIKGFDQTTKKTTMSMDLLIGAFAFDPRRITLLASY